MLHRYDSDPKHAGRVCPRRRRNQLQRCERTWLRPLRPISGRGLHTAQCGCRLFLWRAGLWLAGHHQQPHRHLRSVAGAIQRRRMVRTHRRRLSLCQLLDGTGNYAFAGQFTTFDLPAYAEQALVGASTFALAYGAKSVTASRSELGLRSDKSFAMPDGIFTLRGRAAWAHDFNTERIFGATFQTLPGASFVVMAPRRARLRARY